jgi:hypothetical protein
MATIWIHRACASDILIRFDTRGGALLWSYSYLRSFDTASFDDDSQLEGYGFVGCTDSIQLSIHENDFLPSKLKTTESWNKTGTVKVSPEEAMTLKEYGEPDGFVPGESEKVWIKEERTLEELDKEIEGYITEEEDTCTAGIREGICVCCGTCTYDRGLD